MADQRSCLSQYPAFHSWCHHFSHLCNVSSPGLSYVLNYHCIIYQQAICTKVMEFDQVMVSVVQIINSIQAKAKQHQNFKVFLEVCSAECGNLLLYTEVTWSSTSPLSQRCWKVTQDQPVFKIFSSIVTPCQGLDRNLETDSVTLKNLSPVWHLRTTPSLMWTWVKFQESWLKFSVSLRKRNQGYKPSK